MLWLKARVILGLSLIASAVSSDSNSLQLNSAVNEVKITNTSRHEQISLPISISRPFAQGEIPNFAQASINGIALPTQCDVKNRWPDGSLKFGVVSFVVPRIPANGSVVISFSDQTSGNNTGYLTQPEMLSAAYNFEGQIQLNAGTSRRSMSARSILSSAGSCNDPGNDMDAGRYLCTYWLKGPIVTAVILEDRLGRSFDVNTDNGAGNPLHPIFEAWFYPQGNLVQLGYTLENAWASTTPSNSARDQVYSVVLTGGNTNPATLFTNSSFTQITRTRWHKTFCINGTGAGNANACGPVLHVDHNWRYLAGTKAWPHWDPNLQLAPTLIAGYYRNMFKEALKTTLQGCSNCYGGGPGIGLFDQGFNSGGQDPIHGPLTTWDIIYLISQCDKGNSTSANCGNSSGGDMYSVMLANADLGGMIPYFFREADATAGHGRFFDAPSNTVATQGRIVSINARTQISLLDVTGTVNQCNQNFPADYINYGGSGQDLGGWTTDTSHWPNLAYTSYLMSGQYAYYEEQVMQAANAVGNTGGTHACANPPSQASLRQGSKGYWDTVEERTAAWLARENALGAFIAVDGSPEKAYFEDKLRGNLAIWEGSHGIACDIPGTGVQQPYCGARNSYYAYGSTVRTGVPWSGTTLGSWTAGVCCCGQNCYVPNAPICQTGSGCVVPGSANANFQNNYSGIVIGWINDLGYCPQTNGNCQLLAFVQNFYINAVMDPDASMFVLGDYVYPTLEASGHQIPNWNAMHQFYSSGSWPRTAFAPGSCGDETYAGGAIANLSYGYGITSNEGFRGSSAYEKARPALIDACKSGGVSYSGVGGGSPKWDITPRQLGPAPMMTPKQKPPR